MATLDMSTDYTVWDNLETVRVEVFQTVGAAGTSETGTITAKRRAITLREMQASGGAYCASDVKWIIPEKLNVASYTFRPGDLVVDADDRNWTILDVMQGKWQQTWQLTCRDLAIHHSLSDKITIQRSTPIRDELTGAWSRTWAPLHADLLCRVQPQAATVDDEAALGIGGETTSYTVFLSRNLAIDVRECRAVWDGKILDLQRLTMAERIGDLPQLEATLRA